MEEDSTARNVVAVGMSLLLGVFLVFSALNIRGEDVVRQGESNWAAAASAAAFFNTFSQNQDFYCTFLGLFSPNTPSIYCQLMQSVSRPDPLAGLRAYLGVQTAPASSGVGQQALLIDGFDIYSPEPVVINGALKLYFGGWESQADLPHDGIYVANCEGVAGPCSGVRKVIDATASGLYQINDPSIVLHPAFGTTPAYYIMYMTGSTGTDIGSNNIYYSTSWANDGVIWSSPQLLISGYWLPSATWKGDHTELYANSTTNGSLYFFNLGASGALVTPPSPIIFDNPSSVPAYYTNVNVVWRPGINLYQMLAERLLSPSSSSSSVIDYLSSQDGTNWHLQHQSVISADTGAFRVGTPAQHPDSAFYVYFGSTAQQDSGGFKIRYVQWSSSAPQQTIAAVFDQQKALDFIKSLYDPNQQLLKECPTCSRYWLWSDQLVGQMVLRSSEPTLAATIENKMNSFGVSMRSAWATLDSRYISSTSFQGTRELQVGGSVVWYSDYGGGGELACSNYADVAFLKAIYKFRTGDTAGARTCYDYGKSMWDGVGMKDSGQITGQYAVYKTALGLLAQKITGFPAIGIPDNYFDKFQTSNGGITTDITGGQPSGSQNIETTAAVLMAKNPALLR